MRSILRMSIASLLLSAIVGCGGPAPETGDQRDLLNDKCQAALNDFKARDRSLDKLLSSAHAYAVFPDVIAGAAVFGGAHGDGEAFQGGKMVGYAEVSQASFGAQLGGQRYAELILFENESAYVNFTHSQFEMDARVSAIAAANGAADSTNYSRGVVVFTMPDSGFMAQAAIGGQKFHFVPVLRPQ